MYLFLPTKSKKNTPSDMPSGNTAPSYTLEMYKKDFFAKQHDSIQSIISKVEKSLFESKDSAGRMGAFSEIIKMYNGFNSPELSAYYVYQKADFIKNSKSWELCGDNFITVLRDPLLDSMLKSDVAEKATESYSNSLRIDSNNIDAKIKLAQCYMELKNEPMQGVQALLSIVRKDSMNIPANLLLAKFGLISGQYEKVLPRLKKVLSLQPSNVEALLLNADAHAQIGKTDVAIANLEKIISLKNVAPQMKQEITMALGELKKQKK